MTPGIVAKARDVMTKHPNIRAILLECTELPAYADALRKETGLPVYDAITGCDFFMTGVQDNERFGIQDCRCSGWQARGVHVCEEPVGGGEGQAGQRLRSSH